MTSLRCGSEPGAVEPGGRLRPFARPFARSFRGGALRAALCLLCLGAAAEARAQGPNDPDEPADSPQGVIDAWAEAVSDSLSPRWVGPRVPWPDMPPRPASAGVLRSSLHPVAVQVGPGVGPEQAEATLAALELAHGWMERHAWPLPPPDGGHGGTAEFDLYLRDDAISLEAPTAEPAAAPSDPAPPEAAPAEPASPVDEGAVAADPPAPGEGLDPSASPPLGPRRLVTVSYDAPLLVGGLDAAPSFAVLDASVAPSRLTSCVVSAYAQAALLGTDPAEASAWRIATGDYIAWLVTGHFGCSDEGVSRHQQQSWRTWIGSEPDSGEGGALFLAMLSARTDGLTGNFIRDLWQGASQLTWEGSQLRAAPDMWQVVYTVMEVGQDPLDRLLEEMGVARYFAGDDVRRRAAPIGALAELPVDAAVPVLGRAAYEDLPRRFEPHGLELEPYGSAYVVVDTEGAPAGSLLRIWLRGEYGVGWSLTAVRLAADGTARGRVRAPVRFRNSRSYIPLELTDEDTASVLLVVTNLGLRLMDADEPDDQVRSFRLILDRGPAIAGAD